MFAIGQSVGEDLRGFGVVCIGPGSGLVGFRQAGCYIGVVGEPWCGSGGDLPRPIRKASKAPTNAPTAAPSINRELINAIDPPSANAKMPPTAAAPSRKNHWNAARGPL